MSESATGTATKRSRTEARIMRAAAELFAEHGANGVSVRDVAERAGVSHALVHRYFGSKEELVGVAVRDARTRVVDAMRRAENIDAYIDSLFEATLNDPLVARMMLRSAIEQWSDEQIDPHRPIIGLGVKSLRARTAPAIPCADEPLDPRIAMAAVGALSLGWSAAESKYVESAVLGDVDLATVRAQITRIAHLIAAIASTDLSL